MGYWFVERLQINSELGISLHIPSTFSQSRKYAFLQHPHGLQILHHGSSIGNIFLISPYYFILIHYNKLADTKVKIVPKFISIFMCMHIYLLMRKSHKAAFTGQPK